MSGVSVSWRMKLQKCQVRRTGKCDRAHSVANALHAMLPDLDGSNRCTGSLEPQDNLFSAQLIRQHFPINPNAPPANAKRHTTTRRNSLSDPCTTDRYCAQLPFCIDHMHVDGPNHAPAISNTTHLPVHPDVYSSSSHYHLSKHVERIKKNERRTNQNIRYPT